MSEQDDLLTCPRCGGEMHFISLGNEEDQDWDSFHCGDCGFHIYSRNEDLTIDRYDSDPDSLWLNPSG